MTGVQPEAPVADTCEGSESVTAARENLTKAAIALVERAAGTGLAASVATLHRDDPLEAEAAPGDDGVRAGRLPAVAVPPLGDRRVPGPGRGRPRPDAGGGGPPDASDKRPDGARERGRVVAAGRPKASAALVRLSGEVGNRMEECSGEILQGLRKREELPEGAVSLPVSLDGVMMRMNAGTADRKPTDAGWREASCGVVGLVDAEGTIQESRCSGRLPEAGKVSLKAQLRAEALHWLALRPDLRPAAVADGAKDSWTFLESLCPDVTLVDFWHSAQHLSSAADAAFGADTAAGRPGPGSGGTSCATTQGASAR